MIAGIDEAGRGPVIGPLVVAGFRCREEDVSELESLGVRDSKMLSPKRREELFQALMEDYEARVVKIYPKELDSALMKGVSLNRLEGERFGELVNQLEAGTVYIDCADVNPDNFRSHISRVLERQCRLVIAHKADERYPVVSAASIIAKVERDKEIDRLKRKYGDLGSGYTSDDRTVKFLEDWYRENRSFPDFVRRSWRLKLFKNRRLDSHSLEEFY